MSVAAQQSGYCERSEATQNKDSVAVQLRVAALALAPIARENAMLEARLLAGHAWHMSMEDLLRESDALRDAAPLNALVARRLKAEPVAQILGHKHFWRDAFAVSRDVLTPRADSETVIEALLRARPNREVPLRLLDLGTGSGCLALSALREYANASAVAVDQSEAALAVAGANAQALGFAHRCEMLRSNWCSNISGRFDVVLANPPYIPTTEIAALDADVRLYEPHSALDGGADGLDDYRTLVQQLPQHLAAQALVLFEVGAGQAAEVAALGVAAGWAVKEIANDLAGIARVVVFETNF